MVTVTVKLTEDEILYIIGMCQPGRIKDDFIKIKELIDEEREKEIGKVQGNVCKECDL